LEYKLNRTGARTEPWRKAVMFGSPRAGVIARVHPENVDLEAADPPVG